MAENEINIFSIAEPDTYICNVTGFYLGHRILEITMRRPNRIDYLVASFNFVSYFSGPTSWQGANFQIAPNEQLIRIFNSLHHTNEIPSATLIENVEQDWKLYIVSPLNTDIQVQILACQKRLEIKEDQ